MLDGEMEGEKMDYSTLTLEDCIRKQEQENQAVIIENGAVAGFTADKLFVEGMKGTGR